MRPDATEFDPDRGEPMPGGADASGPRPRTPRRGRLPRMPKRRPPRGKRTVDPDARHDPFWWSSPLAGLPRPAPGKSAGTVKRAPDMRLQRRFLPEWLHGIIARCRRDPDREHEMAFNRLLIGVGIAVYIFLAPTFGVPLVGAALLVSIAYICLATLLTMHAVFRPGKNVGRRLAAILTDLGILSYGIHIGGELISVLYPFYLWIIFGNGFRFGAAYLYISAALSALGFSLVVATTPLWLSNKPLSFGLLAGLIVLPAHAAVLIRRLSLARREAEQASEAKSLFLASVSHELRTPLNAVIGMSDLLDGTALGRDQREMTGTIKASAKSLLSLIDDLLQISRIEAGRMPERNVPFDLLELLTGVRRMLAVEAGAKGVRLALHVTPRTPFRLEGDPSQLQEILLNVAGNAVKFTGRGSVTITVDAEGVADDGKAEGGRTDDGTGERQVRLRFEVIDTGIGIAPEAQKRIFENFSQADESIVRRFGGTGLGLAISRKLVELRGGRMGVASEPGVGSTFWFTLPARAAMESVGAGGDGAPSLGRTRIALLSPDGGAVSAAAGRVLAAWPQATRATTIEQATALLAAEQGEGRLLLVEEPRAADLAELAAALRGSEALRGIPAVLVAAAAHGPLPAPLCRSFVSAISASALGSELPRAIRIALSGQAASADAAPAAPAGEAVRRLRILVAEDNRVNQMVTRRILESAGHRVRVVSNGEQALDALEASEFDLVAMDLNMPVMDGIDAARLYRASSLDRAYVPIIALTADATPAAAKRAREAGMDSCVTKPIEAARLLELVQEMVPEKAEAPPAAGGGASSGALRPAPTIDRDALAALEELGGPEFVREVTDGFVTDGDVVLDALRAAVADGDALAFRDQLHALRSGAANIGASSIYEMCLSWRLISSGELIADGDRHLRTLEGEFRRTGDALRRFCAERVGERVGS